LEFVSITKMANMWRVGRCSSRVRMLGPTGQGFNHVEFSGA
jgi:hypothetical protein